MLTPHEVNQHSRGYNERLEREIETQRAVAWSIAALSRAKKLPSYEVWMGGSDTKELSGKELEERKQQHQALVASLEEARSRSQSGNQSR